MGEVLIFMKTPAPDCKPVYYLSYTTWKVPKEQFSILHIL